MSSLLHARVTSSQGFTAGEMNLALGGLKMETASKKHVMHQTDELCRAKTLLKTPCRSPFRRSKYLSKEGMKE